jgi:hypothetical protein
MGILSFIDKHFSGGQQPVAPAPQPSTPTVDGLSASLKMQAVEAARPAAALIENASAPSSAPVQSQSVPNVVARGRSLGMER